MAKEANTKIIEQWERVKVLLAAAERPKQARKPVFPGIFLLIRFIHFSGRVAILLDDKAVRYPGSQRRGDLSVSTKSSFYSGVFASPIRAVPL